MLTSSKYLEYKIAKKLNYRTQEDIKKIIDNIQLKTNATNELIEEVLLRLTQFSSYASLGYLSNELENFNIDFQQTQSFLHHDLCHP